MLQSMRSQRIGDDWTTEQKHDLTANQKIVLKWHHLFFYAITTNHFSIGLWHVTKSGYYMTTDDDQLSHWMEKKFQNTSQSQSCTKKKKGHSHSFTVWWSAAGLIHYSFWILVKPLHLKSMLRKLIRHTENCNACSQNWSTERAQFFSTTTPTPSRTMLQIKTNTIM